MKIKVEIDSNIEEDEIIIKCKEFNDSIYEIQKSLKDTLSKKEEIIFLKDNVEYYILLDKILFFETDKSNVYAHTNEDTYQVKYKLYELEDILPRAFIRISKSTIVNIINIKSINRNIASFSTVEFENSYKKNYISRSYYKEFKNRMMEVRRYYA